jgi:hypothetical protein
MQDQQQIRRVPLGIVAGFSAALVDGRSGCSLVDAEFNGVFPNNARTNSITFTQIYSAGA